MSETLAKTDLTRARAYATSVQDSCGRRWIEHLADTVERQERELREARESEQLALADAASYKHEADVAHAALSDLYGRVSTEIARLHATRGVA